MEKPVNMIKRLFRPVPRQPLQRLKRKKLRKNQNNKNQIFEK
jgi:hypothetical protein